MKQPISCNARQGASEPLARICNPRSSFESGLGLFFFHLYNFRRACPSRQLIKWMLMRAVNTPGFEFQQPLLPWFVDHCRRFRNRSEAFSGTLGCSHSLQSLWLCRGAARCSREKLRVKQQAKLAAPGNGRSLFRAWARPMIPLPKSLNKNVEHHSCLHFSLQLSSSN